MRHPRTTSWITRSPVLAISLAMLAGICGTACSGAGVGDGSETQATVDGPTATTHQAIMGGETDPGSTADAVVALRIGEMSPFELCTGALVAPNLVLTARHCVSEAVAKTVVCNDLGDSTNGAHVGADLDPRTIQIFTGSNPTFAGSPAANVKAIFHPDTDILCDRDVALVLLDKAIDGVTPMKLRVDGGVRPGETVRAVGYGKNDEGLSTGTRMRREGVGVLAIGAGVSASQTSLGPHEFEVGTSICQGDSGGPAISETTGAIVGVVSRGGDCADDFGHIYIETSGWESLFRQAFDAAGAVPVVEDAQPAAPAAPSGSGTTSTGTTSGDGTHAGSSATTQSRSAAAGCSATPVSPANGSSLSLFGVGLGMAALVTRRRRRP